MAIKIVWQVFICCSNSLGQFGFAMMIYGSQRRSKNHASVLMRQLVSFCFVIFAFQILGLNVVVTTLNGILGTDGSLEILKNEITKHKLTILFECAFANTIAQLQLSEQVTLETDILFSILFGSIIFPVSIAWTVSDGWLRGLGYEDPTHASSTFFLATVCGFVGNLVVGAKFEFRKNVFSQVLSKKD